MLKNPDYHEKYTTSTDRKDNTIYVRIYQLGAYFKSDLFCISKPNIWLRPSVKVNRNKHGPRWSDELFNMRSSVACGILILRNPVSWTIRPFASSCFNIKE